MQRTKVIAIGSGAQNVVRGRDFDVFAIEGKESFGDDVTGAIRFAEDLLPALDKFVENYERTLFIVSTLGGCTGSTCTPIVVRHLAEMNKTVVGIVTLPLQFEGSLKRAVALYTIRKMCTKCSKTVVINQNDYIKRLPDITLAQFLHLIDDEVCEIIKQNNKASWWSAMKNFFQKKFRKTIVE